MRRIRFTLTQLLMTVALVAIGLAVLQLATYAERREEVSDLIFFGSSNCLAVQRLVWHERDGRIIGNGTSTIELLDVTNNSQRAIRTHDETYFGYPRETFAVTADGASLLLLPDTPAPRNRVLKWNATAANWDAVFAPNRFASVLLYWEGRLPPENEYERVLIEKWNRIRFSPTDLMLVDFRICRCGCCEDDDHYALQVWEDGSDREKWGNQAAVEDFAWLPDGKRFVVEANNRISILDAETGRMTKQRICSAIAEITSLAISPDGQAMATGHKNGMIIVWDATTFTRIKTVTPQRSVQLPWTVPKVALGVWYFTALILWRRRHRKKSPLQDTIRSDPAGS
jgi:WD40 repeat protein